MHSAHTSWRCAPHSHPSCHAPGHSRWPGGRSWGEEMEDEFGGGFGVRRPLRFLAHRLGLDDTQVSTLARILDELKTERAQAEVDRRRTLATFADSLSGEAFDDAKAGEAGGLRVKSAERVRDAVLKALREIHTVLRPDQRLQLAYLIRTGTLAV